MPEHGFVVAKTLQVTFFFDAVQCLGSKRFKRKAGHHRRTHQPFTQFVEAESAAAPGKVGRQGAGEGVAASGWVHNG